MFLRFFFPFPADGGQLLGRRGHFESDGQCRDYETLCRAFGRSAAICLGGVLLGNVISEHD